MDKRIKVVVKHFVKAENVEKFKSLALELVKHTNEKDEGCIFYDLYRDETNPNTLCFIEEWESRELLNKHMAAPHCKEIAPRLRELDEKPADVSFFIKAE